MSQNFNSDNDLTGTPGSDSLLPAFIEACMQLDSLLVAPYIGEDDVFQDKNKVAFLQSLDELFEMRKRKIGEQFSARYGTSTCNGCSHGKGGSVYHFEFYKNEQKIWFSDFAYLVKKERGVVLDIFRCFSYESACMVEANLIEEASRQAETKWINWEILEDDSIIKRNEDGGEPILDLDE